MTKLEISIQVIGFVRKSNADIFVIYFVVDLLEFL